MRIWLRIPSNNGLHSFLLSFLSIDNPYNSRIMIDGLWSKQGPDRRTFDRRFEATSLDLKSRIDSMGELFVKEKLIDPYIVSVDSSLLKAKGHIWHRTSMENGIVPHSGIDRHGCQLGGARAGPKGGSSGTNSTS